MKKAVIFLGFVNNFGHYIWNDLAGIDLIVNNKKINSIGKIVIGPYAQIPVSEVFPELIIEGVPIVEIKDQFTECIKFDIENTGVPLRVSGNRISFSLRRRIIAWALKSEYANLDKIRQLNSLSMNVWFNLRMHNKSWINQLSGISHVCKFLKKVLPSEINLQVIFDGLPDTKVIVDQFQSSSASLDYRIIDATNVRLSESIVLSCLIDIHLSVIGSGLVIPSWIMGRRGIAHSNRSHIDQKNWWNNVSNSTHDTTFINNKYISDLSYPRFPNSDYVNYFLNPVGLLDKISELTPEIDYFLRHSAVEQMFNEASSNNFNVAASRIINI